MTLDHFPEPPSDAPPIPEGYAYVGLPENYADHTELIHAARNREKHADYYTASTAVLWLYDPRNTKYPTLSYRACRRWKAFGILHDVDAHYCVRKDTELYRKVFLRVWPDPDNRSQPLPHEF
jgi:hypothetical protein